MKIIAVVLISSALATAVHAQTSPVLTNSTPTKIETLESATNAIIVKGIGDAGSVPVGSGMMVFQLKDSFNVDTGVRLEGLALNFEQGNFRRRMVIDYDELGPLLKAMDYILSVNHSVTQLPNFMVSFRTRSGLQVVGIGNQRQTFVQMYLEFDSGERITLNSTQMAQLRAMIANCATALEALGAAK